MSLAIITGGATGIGAAALKNMLLRAMMLPCWILIKRAQAPPEEHPGSVAFFETDVRDRKNVEASVASAVEAFGLPSVLFANAGIQCLSSLFELRDEDIDAVIDTNLKGTIYTVAAVARYREMQAREASCPWPRIKSSLGNQALLRMEHPRGRWTTGKVALGKLSP